MKGYAALTVAATAIVALAGFAGTASAYKGEALAKQAKITIDQARATAKKAANNDKIADEELEKEAGGSGLRYTFDFKEGKNTREVGVDAKTGEVLENGIEGPEAK